MDALEMGLKASANVAKEVVKAFDNGLLDVKRFNFKSQICTTREQSERLLSLGLKKETADMKWLGCSDENGDIYHLLSDVPHHFRSTDIPAWSLHRLIEMMPTMIKRWNQDWELSINGAGVIYFRKDTTAIIEALANNVYDNMISIIEWLIMEGYFNKEYLGE